MVWTCTNHTGTRVTEPTVLSRGVSNLLTAWPHQSAISELQAPAWSWIAEPSRWPDAKPERVSFCCRVLPCDGVSVLPGQRPLPKTFHTHRRWTEFLQSGHA